MVVAGEASGDLHGARLVREMRSRDGRIDFWAVGGRALRAAGARVVVDADTLSVVGITEVFSRLPHLLGAMRTAKKMLRRIGFDLLVLIDFPDFNLHLAAAAKRLGVPVLYYISPQVWAWRKRRVHKIRQRVDHAAVILPFEVGFFRRYGIESTYVGHPLLDDAEAAREAEGLPDAGSGGPPVVGLLPGSRHREVAQHLPVMIDAAERLKSGGRQIRFLVSAAPSVGRRAVEAVLQKRASTDASISLAEAPVEEIFRRCTLAVAVSGTVTLQAALAGTPTVIIYRVSPLSYWTGRLLIRVPYVGLANLIAGRQVMPELIQREASAERIARTVSQMLSDPDGLKRIRRALLQVRNRMGTPGASARVADIAMKMLGASRRPQAGKPGGRKAENR